VCPRAVQDDPNSNSKLKALRWWVTLDDSPPDHGSPVYLKGSHKNPTVGSDTVFVDLEKDGLLAYPEVRASHTSPSPGPPHRPTSVPPTLTPLRTDAELQAARRRSDCVACEIDP
jgi:hypothetical protein